MQYFATKFKFQLNCLCLDRLFLANMYLNNDRVLFLKLYKRNFTLSIKNVSWNDCILPHFVVLQYIH